MIFITVKLHLKLQVLPQVQQAQKLKQIKNNNKKTIKLRRKDISQRTVQTILPNKPVAL